MSEPGRERRRCRWAVGPVVAGVVVVGLVGCGIGTRSVLFVTDTSLAIDVDSKPPALSIGYSRREGTLAPVVAGGRVLPQMASFRFRAGVGQAGDEAAGPRGVRVGVGQSFATGTAALLLSKYLGSSARPDNRQEVIPDEEIRSPAAVEEAVENSGRRRRYFFGTDTTVGIKVTFGLETGGWPDRFVLGWKRKELAYVPLLESTGGTAGIALPSLIATAGLSAEATRTGADNVFTQFYATGDAASYLAAQPGIREVIGLKVLDTEEYQRAVRGLQAELQDVRRLDQELSAEAGRLIDGLGPEQLDAAVSRAVAVGLITEQDRARYPTEADQKRDRLKSHARAGDNRSLLGRLMRFVDELRQLSRGG